MPKHHRLSLWYAFTFMFVLGCSQISVVGIQPEYPPVKRSGLSLFSDYHEIHSLQPTFRWQRFPAPSDKGLLKAEEAGRLKNVTYELRIWKSTPELPGKLVYGRKDIPAPHHTIDELLLPSTHYLWSVRAHFLMDNRPQVTEWSMAGYALRDETVPNMSCLRFITPGRPN